MSLKGSQGTRGSLDAATTRLLRAWDRYKRGHPATAERLIPVLRRLWRVVVRGKPQWGSMRERQLMDDYRASQSATRGPDHPMTESVNGTVPEAVHVAGIDLASRYITQVLQVPRLPGTTHVSFRRYSRVEHRVKTIGFYLPQFHPIPENDAWWGRGFTEWANVARAVPQYVGHEQPRIPADLGYYDLRLADIQRQQVDIARNYGIAGFCFHHYWFGGRRLLERPLDAYVADRSLDLPFCISWANENWTRRWDGLDDDVLIGQSSDPAVDATFADGLIPYLRDDRYLRVGGRPLILVYRPSLMADARLSAERWRETFMKAGIGEVLLGMAQFDTLDPRPYGFDVAVEFPPHKLGRDLPRIQAELEVVNPEYDGIVHRYADIVERARDVTVEPYDLIRGVMPSWDNSARRPGGGTVFHGSTPESYRDWLTLAGRFALEHPVHGESLVFVNAWNEWAEAAYLEPDRARGYAYLEATRRGLLELDRDGDGESAGLVLVVHDAHRHGAQLNALNMARTAAEVYDVRPEIILLEDGELRDEFERWGTVHAFGPIRDDGAAQDSILAALRARGITQAIANTVVSGRLVRQLRSHGFRVVSLVHELPGLIREHGLEDEARDIAQLADRVVFASDHVRSAFESLNGKVGERGLTRPQGLYLAPETWEVTPETREAARRALGLPEGVEVVLAVGYADLRKGIDLFVRVFATLRRRRAQVLFVWLGCEDPESVEWYTQEAEALGYGRSLRLLPRQPDVSLWYQAASVLALPSREDPYPSVVLEALSNRVPVVAFEGATGLEDLLLRGCGLVVPYMDVESMATAIDALLSDGAEREVLGAKGQGIVRQDYDWSEYVGFLLGLTGLSRPTVSVIVPNYNHARFLHQRIASIRRQGYPVSQLIVLDDASTDDSLGTLASLQDEFGPFTVVANDSNSGNVFRQWAKGVEMATGDLVWIAESDDFADPGFLSRVARAFVSPDVVLAYAESRQVDAAGRVMAEHYHEYVADVDPRRWLTSWVRPGAAALADSLSVKNTIPNVSAVIFRRDGLAEVLGSEMEWITSFEIAGDWAVYVAILLRGGDLAFVAESLNNHRRHDDGVTISAFGRLVVDEIVRMQEHVRRQVAIPPDMARLAKRYVSELETQFDLVPAAPSTRGDGVTEPVGTRPG